MGWSSGHDRKDGGDGTGARVEMKKGKEGRMWEGRGYGWKQKGREGGGGGYIW